MYVLLLVKFHFFPWLIKTKNHSLNDFTIIIIDNKLNIIFSQKKKYY